MSTRRRVTRGDRRPFGYRPPNSFRILEIVLRETTGNNVHSGGGTVGETVQRIVWNCSLNCSGEENATTR